MQSGDIVAVFCDEDEEQRLTERISKLEQFPCKIFPVRNGPSMYRAARIFDASRSGYRCALNLCSGTTEDDRKASPAVLASLFEESGTVYGGCRYTTLKQPLDTLFMMCFYAGLPLPRFSVVSSCMDIEQLNLQFPLKMRNASPFQGLFEAVVEDVSTLQQAFLEVSGSYDKVVVWEVNAEKANALQALVWSSGSVIFTHDGIEDNAWVQRWSPTLKDHVAAFTKNVMEKNGFAMLRFNQCPRADHLVLEDMKLNCSLVELDMSVFSTAVARSLLECCLREGECTFKPSLIELRLATGKGYFLCAAHCIKRGEFVFRDEGRRFTVVTKPFVEKNWGPEDKQLFTEYAWPLDSDGHVYAIWESDPSAWRPINHSCDPNCVFDLDHSLNVVAARDIKMGEELTMDYSTFCDYTMKSFSCFCGSKCCRGLIVPDEAALQKYGTRAWHRRPPRPPANST